MALVSRHSVRVPFYQLPREEIEALIESDLDIRRADLRANGLLSQGLDAVLRAISPLSLGQKYLYLLAYVHSYLRDEAGGLNQVLDREDYMPREIEDELLEVYHDEKMGLQLNSFSFAVGSYNFPSSWFMAHVYVKEGLSVEPLGIDWDLQKDGDGNSVYRYLLSVFPKSQVYNSFRDDQDEEEFWASRDQILRGDSPNHTGLVSGL